VTGAPSTSRIGVSIDSSMCAAMCMLNMAGIYRPTPDDVANSRTRHPSSHATVRPTGHVSPRRRSLTTAAMYTRANTIAAVPNTRSKRQSNRMRATVGGPARS
jgi:hypothetical protein